MTIFQEFHNFVDEYKITTAVRSKQNRVSRDSYFLRVQIFTAISWQASVIVCQKNR